MWRNWIGIAAIALGLVIADGVIAQNSLPPAVRRASGLFGSRTLGQGTTSRAGSGFGGDSGAANSAAPGNAVETLQADAGQASGDERFIRENRDPAAFVGADSADASGFFGQQAQGVTLSGLEQFAAAAASRDFQNQNGGGSSLRSPLRPRLVLGFTPPMRRLARHQSPPVAAAGEAAESRNSG